MDKVGYPKGLVRFTTENALAHGLNKIQMWENVLRPRVVIYTSLLGTLVLLIGISLALRTPFKMDVVRDRGALARFTDHDSLENVYRLQVMNASESTKTFHLNVGGLPNVYLHSSSELSVPPTQSSWVPVQVDVPYPDDTLQTGSHRIWFELVDLDTHASIKERSVFIVPR
jgi:polyferredoxin